MSLFRLLACAALSLAVITPAYAAKPAPTPAGYWLTENKRAVIRVESCTDRRMELCGYLHWIIKGGMQYDEKNADSTRRRDPLCGIRLMHDFEKEDETHWIDGHIYKADDGFSYNATLELLPDGKMMVRGYIGFPWLGKSQTWTRVNPKQYPQCKAPGR